MKLTGHAAAVLTMKFDPSGAHIASGGKDKNVFLWNTLGDCENYAVLRGHKNAVTEVAWAASGEGVWSASADKTLGFWDATTGVRARKFGGHRGVVNGVAAVRRGSMALAASAGDDGAVKLWDARTRGCVQEFEAGWPQTCVAFDDAGDGVFSGGIDNDVKVGAGVAPPPPSPPPHTHPPACRHTRSQSSSRSCGTCGRTLRR